MPESYTSLPYSDHIQLARQHSGHVCPTIYIGKGKRSDKQMLYE